MPFWPLQNYTGVGTGLTKYLPRNIAMVNEGEGGLNAADNLHYNMVESRIKEGDYLYVEYGHNHKDDGPTGYVNNLDKYYNKCHEVGAKLIIVSPIEHINTFSDGAYQYTLRGFATAGEEYVAGKVFAGATDIAYVDLNKFSLAFYNKIVTDNDNNSGAIKYYFQTAKGGGTDITHPNDAGAEALAYEFMQGARAITDTTQKAVVDGFLTTATEETPHLVDITAVGKVAGDAWPTYVVQTDNEYPVVINDVVFGDDGKVESVTVKTQAAKIKMETYGIIIITVKNEDGTEKGKIYAVDQVDNSVGYGSQTITNFRGDVTLEEGDTYSAIVMKALDNEGGLVVDEEANIAYSAEYIPSDIVAELLLNEDGDGPENFKFFGKTYGGDEPSTLPGCNGWTHAGSAGATLTLGEASDGTKYTEVSNDGAKAGAANQGSFYLWKALEKGLGTSGKYLISMDIKYVSGDGLNATLSTGNSSKDPWGTATLNLFTINSSGNLVHGSTELGQISATSFSNVQFILDMDLGKGYASINGGTPVEVDYTNYQTTSTTVTPTNLTNFMFDSNKKANDAQVASLRVAELKRDALPEYKTTVASSDTAKGTVSVSGVNSTGVALGYDSETGKAAVKADKAMTVQLIEAKYTGKALTEIVPTTLTFEAAGTKTADVTAGSKLMVWKTLGGVEPVVKAIDATETVALPADNEVTNVINTATIVTATPAEGSVFMGWYDNAELTGEPVSMDNPYTFRLRGNTALTAKFVREPGVIDITNYSLASEKANVKAVSGATFNVNIADAVDSANTPISVAKNSDATWESQTAGVTVANGVVTIGSDFAITLGETKPITVKATLNGIEKTCTITAHLYDYYEDFDGGDVTKLNWFTNLGAGKVEIKDGALAMTSQNSNNNTYSGTHFAAPADVADKLVTIKLDYKTSSVSTATNNTSHWFLANLALTENTPTYAETYSGGKGVSFQNNTTVTEGVAQGLAIAGNTKYAVTIVINNKTKTAQITATPESGDAITYSIADTKQAINTLYFRPGRNLTDTIDNLSVVIADAPTE